MLLPHSCPCVCIDRCFVVRFSSRFVDVTIVVFGHRDNSPAFCPDARVVLLCGCRCLILTAWLRRYVCLDICRGLCLLWRFVDVVFLNIVTTTAQRSARRKLENPPVLKLLLLDSCLLCDLHELCAHFQVCFFWTFSSTRRSIMCSRHSLCWTSCASC